MPSPVEDPIVKAKRFVEAKAAGWTIVEDLLAIIERLKAGGKNSVVS